jgi:hypothetical protein
MGRFVGLLIGLFGVLNLTAQTTQIIGKSVYELRTETFESAPALAIPHLLFSDTQNTSIPDLHTFTTDRYYQAPSSYRYQDLAFFCRLEVKMEKASKMPVRFRLGTVDYVDYLEGKRDRY